MSKLDMEKINQENPKHPDYIHKERDSRERMLKSFLALTSFKNVSGNWQFRGDMSPERTFKIMENILLIEGIL